MTVPPSVKVALASLGLGGAIGATVALLLVVGECRAFKADHPKAADPVATVLPQTPAEIATPKELIECVQVQALRPTEKRRKQIAQETGIALPPAVTLEGGKDAGPGEIVPQIATSEPAPDFPVLMVDGRPYPPSPEGGKIYSLLEMDGSNTLVVLPNPEKPRPEDRFFEFGNVFEIGGLYGIGQEGDTRSRAWAAYEPLRLGRIHLRAEAGVDIRDGASGGYVLAGAVWRSR